jgi:hypothetical protein
MLPGHCPVGNARAQVYQGGDGRLQGEGGGHALAGRGGEDRDDRDD